MRRKFYPSDISDEEWDILEPLIPSVKSGGRPRTTNMREVINAIWYVLRTGCQWRMIPHEFPPWSTVWSYFRIWRKTGVWEQMHTCLRERLRSRLGREPKPIRENESKRGERGYDGGKKVNGRKRHIVVDTLGLIARVKVHPADLQDREAVPLMLEGMNEQFPRISHAWVDQGYTGIGKQWIEEQLKWTVEVVRHPPRPRGMWVFPGQEIDMTLFQCPKSFRGVLPRRWVVERTFASK
jgi:putative transposase